MRGILFYKWLFFGLKSWPGAVDFCDKTMQMVRIFSIPVEIKKFSQKHLTGHRLSDLMPRHGNKKPK
jgi:hypothetical protein